MDREHLRTQLQERLRGGTVSGVSLGQGLREARESRNIQLQEIADSTRIGQRYFKALEADDLSVLPGGIYGKNYIRAYARFIGLDPEQVLDSYLEACAPEDPGPSQKCPRRMGPSLSDCLGKWEDWGRLRRMWMILPVSVLLIGIEGWALFRGEAYPPAQSSVRLPTTLSALPKDHEVASSPVLAATLSPASLVAISPADSEAMDSGPGLWSIPDSGVGTAVVEYQLQNRADRFAEGSRVWFWTQLVGADSGERLWHVWMQEGREVASVELAVGGRLWRTQSSKYLRPGSVGEWTVEARDSSGRVLALAEFTCWKSGSNTP